MSENCNPQFDVRYDERFSCGFTDGRGRELLTLRWKPAWQMTALEVIRALNFCKVAVEEAKANAVEERDAWGAEERLWRLERLVSDIIADPWTQRKPDGRGMSYNG